jgi:hypothetical protein
MNVHDETIDDLTGEGTIIIDGQSEGAVSYCLSVCPDGGPVLAEGSISGPEPLMSKIREPGKLELALADGPVVTLERAGGSTDTEWVTALTPKAA